LKRLSREQSQARTRSRLLRSAAQAFVREGVEGATIEQVSENAGYSRGAFYANFSNKEDLCLVLLEQGFDEYLERFGDILATDEEPEIRAQRAGDHFSQLVAADPDWQRLFFELEVYALRNRRFRRKLVERHRVLRERVSEVFRARAADYGVESPVPLDQLTMMTFAMSTGFALEKLLEPDLVSDQLYGTMLAIFFAGLRKLVEDADDTGNQGFGRRSSAGGSPLSP